MLRNVALVLLPIALLVAACGGGSTGDALQQIADELEPTIGPAGPDGIYNTEDDPGASVLDDTSDLDDQGDAPAALADEDVVADDDVVSTTDADDGGDMIVADPGGDLGDTGGSLDDNAVFGALNPLTFLGGTAFSQGTVDPDLGSALLTLADVPGQFQEAGEFTFSMPSEYGNMDMTARMFATGDDLDEFGAMIMSAVMTLPPEAMSEFDELTGLTEADIAEMQDVADEFGTGLVEFSILDASSLGEAGFGMHMEIDFGELLSVFGAPDDGSVPSGIVMEMYGFAAGDIVMMVMTMWPAGDSAGADALALAQIKASRA